MRKEIPSKRPERAFLVHVTLFWDLVEGFIRSASWNCSLTAPCLPQPAQGSSGWHGTQKQSFMSFTENAPVVANRAFARLSRHTWFWILAPSSTQSLNALEKIFPLRAFLICKLGTTPPFLSWWWDHECNYLVTLGTKNPINGSLLVMHLIMGRFRQMSLGTKLAFLRFICGVTQFSLKTIKTKLPWEWQQ